MNSEQFIDHPASGHQIPGKRSIERPHPYTGQTHSSLHPMTSVQVIPADELITPRHTALPGQLHVQASPSSLVPAAARETATLLDTPYRIVEIFETLQGEGFNTGMPSIFIRFGKCNLACPWCDTDYNRFGTMTLGDILAKVQTFSARNVIITGGEPTIQPHLERLLDSLKAEGHFLAIETNGLKPVPPQIDYIATSPKRFYQKAYVKHHIDFAHEVRIVVDGDVRDFCAQIEGSIRADRYYLSPCEVDGRMNMLETITQLGQLNQRPDRPRWQLSIQTHKLAGIE